MAFNPGYNPAYNPAAAAMPLPQGSLPYGWERRFDQTVSRFSGLQADLKRSRCRDVIADRGARVPRLAQTGKPYFVNHTTGTTSWDAPAVGQQQPQQPTVGLPVVAPVAQFPPARGPLNHMRHMQQQHGGGAAGRRVIVDPRPADVASVKAKISALSPAELATFFGGHSHTPCMCVL